MERQAHVELRKRISNLSILRPVGRVQAVSGNKINVIGLGTEAQMGNRVLIKRREGGCILGEIIQVDESVTVVFPEEDPDGLGVDDRVIMTGPIRIAPDMSWIGRVLDPDGRALDGRPIESGFLERSLRSAPPSPARRRGFGDRLDTGFALFNTILPIVRGQRVGLFAGSGVGKSTLLGGLAQKMQADVIVIGLIGERGREVRDFVEKTLGAEGLARSVVIAATSDRSPLVRRRCATTAMAVAEFFRDKGLSVLLLADSISRFAEAHREVAIAGGEAPVLRGYPPSTAQTIMALCERAGPGADLQGDISAIFSVLVSASDMDEPIADILRGVLDGHFLLDRTIAERGRFPAVDVLRSVSRSLPDCASEKQNAAISKYRRILGHYSRNEMMISSGLYSPGSDPIMDQAIGLMPDIEAFASRQLSTGIDGAFDQLEVFLRREPTRATSVSRS